MNFLDKAKKVGKLFNYFLWNPFFFIQQLVPFSAVEEKVLLPEIKRYDNAFRNVMIKTSTFSPSNTLFEVLIE